MQLSNIRTSSCKAKLLSQLNVEVCVASETLKYFSRQTTQAGTQTGCYLILKDIDFKINQKDTDIHLNAVMVIEAKL